MEPLGVALRLRSLLVSSRHAVKPSRAACSRGLSLGLHLNTLGHKVGLSMYLGLQRLGGTAVAGCKDLPWEDGVSERLNWHDWHW